VLSEDRKNDAIDRVDRLKARLREAGVFWVSTGSWGCLLAVASEQAVGTAHLNTHVIVIASK
jgi:hypothetical protein